MGRVESLASNFKANLQDYVQFFTKHQGNFKGIRKTYIPRPDTIDLPTERVSIAVVTTVQEKLDWFVETNERYITDLFSVEATNAGNIATASLEVDGIYFGEFTSLELLRLVSLLESVDMKNMYANIPVRSDAEDWQFSHDDLYENRYGIWELPKISGIKRSISKESYILEDPNVDKLKDTSKYTPIQSSRDTVLDLGDWTVQSFTGEFSHTQRANILRRYSKLLIAAKDALKTANEAITIESNMTAKKLFGYLHEGKI